jgi:predicted RNase H-like nuclease (RuvC/YqgF family)
MVCLSALWLGISIPAQAQEPTPAAAKPAQRLFSETETLKNELKETKDRLQAFEAENESLRRRNESNKKAIGALNESLAVANAESEFFRRQYGELKLRMEALGMESIGDNKEALEQRLLKAVRDLALTQQARDELSERLVALSEAVMLFIKSASEADPQLRMDVEGQLRAANGALDASGKGATSEAAPDLMNAKVISVKDEYALVVANIGARQGVKAGMPFRVIRGDHGVARVRVVTVRDRICGAVVEEYASTVEVVKVGDQLRVDAQQ